MKRHIQGRGNAVMSAANFMNMDGQRKKSETIILMINTCTHRRRTSASILRALTKANEKATADCIWRKLMAGNTRNQQRPRSLFQAVPCWIS